MIPRYAHPEITVLWSPTWTYQTWLHIEVCTLSAQRQFEVLSSEADPLLTRLRHYNPSVDMQALTEILAQEAETGHDVVAFLNWMRSHAGPAGRFLHFGLTSSDLVDTAQGVRFKEATRTLRGELADLSNALTSWAVNRTPILGRTHGQVAEPMEIRARGMHWLTLLSVTGRDLLHASRRLQVCKLSGPVGTYAHNPPQVEVQVAVDLGLQPAGAGSSQILPRASLAAWASSAAAVVEALAKVATDIRLMNLLGEATIARTDRQVGSSSMPHKKNPIVAEQICGLAQIARGYALMLQPIAGWLERDIAHSSVERVAVPDLWHLVLHAIKQTVWLLEHTELDQWVIAESFRRAGGQPLSSQVMLERIREGASVEVARQDAVTDPLPAEPTVAKHFMQNYPTGGYNESV